jgi:hypothetical protein
MRRSILSTQVLSRASSNCCSVSDDKIQVEKYSWTERKWGIEEWLMVFLVSVKLVSTCISSSLLSLYSTLNLGSSECSIVHCRNKFLKGLQDILSTLGARSWQNCCAFPLLTSWLASRSDLFPTRSLARSLGEAWALSWAIQRSESDSKLLALVMS